MVSIIKNSIRLGLIYVKLSGSCIIFQISAFSIAMKPVHVDREDAQKLLFITYSLRIYWATANNIRLYLLHTHNYRKIENMFVVSNIQMHIIHVPQEIDNWCAYTTFANRMTMINFYLLSRSMNVCKTVKFFCLLTSDSTN